MKHHRAIVFACCSALILPSCHRQTASQTPSQTPSLVIEAPEHYPFGSGVDAMLWKLSGQRIRELTARLLVMKDGQRLPDQEIVCRWEDPAHAPATVRGQLCFAIQDGQPFGVKDKLLPSFGIHFQEGGPSSTDIRRSGPFIEGHFPHITTTSGTHAEKIDSSRLYVVYAKVFDPGVYGEQSFGTLEGLMRTSKGGRVVLAITLEWSPMDPP